ncbi:aminoacyl-tRNA hydrolase [Alterisphingorhabdus coralli]|uniref:Peptidyl-tRNA hydrolase n=1 Tax=Alterisphingorhabdus coralli TaxID=3071408 RepID=A0AA97F945_9SPHN|nr:aminoacyl-tRNA hydrolase [Parasphingorhabdus sp. SCSIO 66989]WOE76421.1 aminoacyl-tRNA hydrolase [Parasphingorhabdus sp. SCSIO 66989]
MQLWVGLGNPGPEYALNRHNVGFMVLDALAEVHDFSAPKVKFQGWVAEGRLSLSHGGSEKLLLLKPATFMNKSGQSIGEAMRFYKLTPDDVTIFHDELDLVPFKIKVKRGGGTAGHNGLRSTDQHIGPDFRRVRIGIGHPGSKARVHGHVLGNYAKAEMDSLTDMLGAIAAEAHWLAEDDDARFMSNVALRMQE